MEEELRLLTPEEAVKYTELIKAYSPSEDIVRQFSVSNFCVIAGPTGAGKDTIRNGLIQKSPDIFHPIISTTSRPPRELEAEDVDYHFREINFIAKGLESRRFLSAEVVHDQQISCLDYSDIEDVGVNEVGIAILVVETEIKLRPMNPDQKSIFITAPDLRTLISRVTIDRSMSSDELERRLRAARSELTIALDHPEYFCIINDEIERAIGLSEEFFLNGTIDEKENQNARNVMQNILNELSSR